MLICNLMGPPGAGKSTTASGVFYNLKVAGIEVEYCHEYAKNLVYEERAVTLRSQPYIFGKQLRNIEMLKGKVDVVITDSPLILCRYYQEKYKAYDYPESFSKFVTEQYKLMGGLTFFLERQSKYNPNGRLQTEEESNQVGEELKFLLSSEQIDYLSLPADENVVRLITDIILERIDIENF